MIFSDQNSKTMYIIIAIQLLLLCMCFSKVKYGNKQITTIPRKSEGIIMNNWQEIAPDQMWLADTLD